jgi:hypothetical protein
MADFDEMWEELERKGWEVAHHGEKQRTRWLLPRGVECDPRARHHTYIQQLLWMASNWSPRDLDSGHCELASLDYI